MPSKNLTNDISHLSRAKTTPSVHKVQVILPKHLRFRMKAIQRRLDSANSAAAVLREVGNTMNTPEEKQPESVGQRDAPMQDVATTPSKDSQTARIVSPTTTSKRSVHFAPMAKVVLIRRPSSEEVKTRWYRTEEYRKFDQDRRRTVSMILQARVHDLKIDSERYTIVGVEKYVESAMTSMTSKRLTNSCDSRSQRQYPSNSSSSRSSSSSHNDRKDKVWQHTQEVLANQYYDRMYQMQPPPPPPPQQPPHYGYYSGYSTPYCMDPMYGPYPCDPYRQHHYNPSFGFAPPISSYSCCPTDKSVVITPAA